MGWPKKNEEYRLYYERKAKTYLLITIDPNHKGTHSCVCEVLTNNNPENPMLCHSDCSPLYISENWLKRVQWDELPKVWQAAFKDCHLDIDPREHPENIRGLWRTENFKPINLITGADLNPVSI